MSIPYGLLSDSHGILFNTLLIISLLFVAYYTPWYRFRYPQFRHVFFGTVIGLIVLWNVDAGAFPGLNFHFIGVMLVTLMFRWQYSIWIFTLAIFSEIFTGQIELPVFAMNTVLFAIIPVYVTNLIYKLVDRRLPSHFFIYIYVAGFFGAAFTALFIIVETALFLWATDVYTWNILIHDYIRYSPMMMFAEGFITGMVITLLVVFKPEWVLTFSDQKYIQGK
jgi:uncharacterized membrane protein